jgi:hypothetical protein
MSNNKKFSLLRKVLRTLGLSSEAVDDLVQRVAGLLSDQKKKPQKVRFPYHLRDDFLTPAEHNFYLVLNKAVGDWALICPKVSLNDLFYAKSSDYGQYLTCTNKIDRKHVDFLLCEPQSVRPMLGIELDDKSHRRKDRQKRDRFVEGVFAAAKLPLVRLSVQRAYNIRELNALLRQQARLSDAPPDDAQNSTAQESLEPLSPTCPRCGNEMVLRTAKSGPNRGNQFWGCPSYPRCRGIRQYEAVSQPTE